MAHLIPKADVYILDKSGATLDTLRAHVDTQRIRLVHYNAEDTLAEDMVGIADMVFFDPPWYVDYYDLFFRRSAQLIGEKYGTVAAVLFPVLTRPNALHERAAVFTSAMTTELTLVAFEAQLAHYLTPHFEQEALQKQGIQAKNWRRGDLTLFITNGQSVPENIGITVEKFQWYEALIGKIKVKVKKQTDARDAYERPELVAIRSGETQLATVSRRDPMRDEIDLWTSTHHAFKLKGSETVWVIVQGIRARKTLDEVVADVKGSFLRHCVLPDTVYDDVHGVWLQLHKLLSTETAT